MPRRLRLPRTTAAARLQAAAAIAGVLILGVALPISAGARPRGRSAAHKPAAHRVCAAGAHRRSKRSRSHQACTGGRPTRRPSTPVAGALHATPLGAGGAWPTLASSQPSPTGPTPGSAPGRSPRTPAGEAPAKPGAGGGAKGGPLPIESGEAVNDPIDPRFLTAAPFGTKSFWLQPWRAYQDTWPASRLLDSVGINFNVSPAAAEGTAQLLQDSGFKLARLGINWSALSYGDPSVFLPDHLASITARLTALHNHGLRPLIVLDAYSGAPAPMKHVTLETTAPAPSGSRTVRLTPASAALVVPRRTGFNSLSSFKGSPDILITAVSSTGVATLARPLPQALAEGPHGGTTLLYEPFAAPKLLNGEPNPTFQATLAGWLGYVGAVSKLAASVVGAEGFDLEVWNELTFGSQFLNAENYYSAAAEEPGETVLRAARSSASLVEGGPGGEAASDESQASPGAEEEGSSERSETDYGTEAEPASEAEDGPEAEGAAPEEAAVATRRVASRSHRALVNREIRKALLDATVAYVRSPTNGIPSTVGITNGFASQTPFPSGANAPIGLTALSKHPYVGVRSFPADYGENHIVPLNAQGTRDTLIGSFKPLFVPAYQSLLPEYTLTATGTETLIRDVAPMTTYIYGYPHGRDVGPAGGSPVQKWITEYNLSPGKATVVGPDGLTPQSGGSASLSSADRAHFQAKALLRSLVAMVNKGMTREYFFAAAPGTLSLIGGDFFAALEAHPGTYPGDQLGGETMAGFRGMLGALQGPGPAGAARQLKIDSIAQEGNHAQFAGDGTAAHPPLYDRDVLAVFPFQTAPRRFVIPVYVMTRDLLTLYRPGSPQADVGRFDLPAERFQITLANLPRSRRPPSVSAYDPLSARTTPARVVSHRGRRAVVEIAVTDYPRLLSIELP